MNRSLAKGFTLTELVITVAIVALLTTIAVPSYRSYVMRANRTVAKNTAADILSRQESFRVDRKRYATDLQKLGLGASTLYVNREGTLETGNFADSIYQVTLQGNPGSTSCPPGGSATTTGFTIVMAPINTQSNDSSCASLCESSAGIRGSSSGNAAQCWQK